jgi:hypothetical protein
MKSKSSLRFSFSRIAVPTSAFISALMVGACGSSAATTGSAAGASADGGPTATSDLCASPPADLTTSQQHSRTCALGDDARFFVRSAPYTKVVIEIGSTKSATPSQAATDHLVAIMGDLLDKSGGVTVMHDPPVDDVATPMSLAQAAAVEDGSRTQFPLNDTVVFYYLVVSTSSTDDSAAGTILGYSYRPSSMVVFQKNIDASAGGIGQPSRDDVESTVVAHEFGHILGLVNAGTPMQTPHEDSAHPKHDVNSACLMYWANNSSAGLANLLTGGTVPDYDANCRADITALKQ